MSLSKCIDAAVNLSDQDTELVLENFDTYANSMNQTDAALAAIDDALESARMERMEYQQMIRAQHPNLIADRRQQQAQPEQTSPENEITMPPKFDESLIVSPIQTGPEVSAEEQAMQLRALGLENERIIKPILKKIDELFGTKSGVNHKELAKIVEKSVRPSVLKKKPWHGVQHIRDGFRFKTVLQNFDDLPEIIKRLQVDAGIEIVKADVAKALTPLTWGWRIVAFDLRMPNGQIIEWYLPVQELEAAKKNKGHLLFENWRNEDMGNLDSDQMNAFSEDLAESNRLYQTAWEQFKQRTGQSESSIKPSLAKASAFGMSETRLNELYSSLPEMDGPLDQDPSASRNMEPRSDMTSTSDSSDSNTMSMDDVPPVESNIVPEIVNTSEPVKIGDGLVTNTGVFPADSAPRMEDSGDRRRRKPAVKRKIEIENRLRNQMRRENHPAWRTAKLTVVATQNELPGNPPSRDEAVIRGAYNEKTDQIYLVAENIPDDSTLTLVLRHEMIGHQGLRRLLNKEGQFDQVMGRIFDSRNGELSEEYQWVERNYPELFMRDTVTGRPVRDSNGRLIPKDKRKIADEMAARAMEVKPGSGPIEWLYDQLQKMLQAIGLVGNQPITRREMDSFIRRSTRQYEQNKTMRVLRGSRLWVKGLQPESSGGVRSSWGGTTGDEASDVRYSQAGIEIGVDPLGPEHKQSRVNLPHNQVLQRVSQLQQGAKDLQEGKITKEDYDRLVNTYKPIAVWDSVPAPATRAEIEGALKESQKQRIGKGNLIKEGNKVGLRLDIPAYNNHAVWVPTIHEAEPGKGRGPIAHESVAVINNAQFKDSGNKAMKVAAGGAKSPFAVIDGEWSRTTEADAVAEAEAALNDPAWVQIGMDPERHSYFYDRQSTNPVVAADRVVQIGALVLAKNPTFGDKSDFLFSKLGSDMSQESRMARAREQGFDTERVWYHGTNAVDFDSFDPDQGWGAGPIGVWLDDSPQGFDAFMNMEGGRVIPVFVKNHSEDRVLRIEFDGPAEIDLATLLEKERRGQASYDMAQQSYDEFIEFWDAQVATLTGEELQAFKRNNTAELQQKTKDRSNTWNFLSDIQNQRREAFKQDPWEILMARVRKDMGLEEGAYIAPENAKAWRENAPYDRVELVSTYADTNMPRNWNIMLNSADIRSVNAPFLPENDGGDGIMYSKIDGDADLYANSETDIQNGYIDRRIKHREAKGEAIMANQRAKLLNKTEAAELQAKAEVELQAANSYERQASELLYSQEKPPTSEIFVGMEQDPVGGSLGMPEESKYEKFVRLFQDSFNRVKKLQDTIVAQGGRVRYEGDVYLAEELSSGKIASRLDELKRNRMDPLLEIMSDNNIKLEQLDEYLVARHAQERNAYIASINDEMPDGGSGMTNQQAQDILDIIAEDGEMMTALEQAAEIVYQVNRQHLSDLVRGGHLSAEEAAALNERWQYYVPLKGREGDVSRMGSGQGYGVIGRAFQRAMGRGEGNMAESPVAHTFAQTENGIVRTEKTRVGQALLQLVRDNPDPNFWTIGQRTYQRMEDQFGEAFEGYETAPEGMVENIDYHRVINSEGKVVYKLDPNYKHRDDIFGVMVDGQEFMIKIEDEILMEQLKKMNMSQLNYLSQSIGSVNRFLAMINTALNPEFVITNFQRDFQTAMVNLGGEWNTAIAGQVAKDIPAAIRGIWQDTFNTSGNSEYRGLYQEMRQEGGAIGFFGMEDIDARINKIQTALEMKDGVLGASLRGIAGIRDVILDANLAVENAARVASYKVMRDALMANGMPEQEAKSNAASVAKNLTVNFNRKGELAPLLNSAYLFYNASIQGSFRVIKALQNPRVQKIAGGIAMTAFGLAMYNRGAGGEDEDGIPYWDKIPAWRKQTNLIIMHPDGSGNYSSIRLPYGYNVFHYTGTNLHDSIFNPRYDTMEAGMNQLSATMNAFNPIQGANLADTFLPTVTKPIVQDMFNYNFMNQNIRPDYPFDDYDRPESQKAWKSTNPVLKDMMVELNALTGGDESHKGWLDISPETVKHYTGWLTGGAGMTVFRGVDTAINLATGEEIEIGNIPFARTVSGSPGVQYDRDRYYSAMKDIAAVENQLDVLRGTDNYQSYLAENMDVHRLSIRVRPTKNAIKRLRTLQDQAQADGDYDLAGEYKEQIRQRMMEFSMLYEEALAAQLP